MKPQLHSSPSKRIKGYFDKDSKFKPEIKYWEWYRFAFEKCLQQHDYEVILYQITYYI